MKAINVISLLTPEMLEKIEADFQNRPKRPDSYSKSHNASLQKPKRDVIFDNTLRSAHFRNWPIETIHRLQVQGLISTTTIWNPRKGRLESLLPLHSSPSQIALPSSLNAQATQIGLPHHHIYVQWVVWPGLAYHSHTFRRFEEAGW
ncbi:unnamed protein product [Fraxinus pennsylvanica]|uniref:Uncharacterized protein n=1 Tax=Fraxinus pennsylvanica TaxID=56036 RepID=A0AAD1YUT2_9LAMI|nr:unnamed protein product [Fraxinus pennsylvanica]